MAQNGTQRESQINSLIAIDVGSVHTKAVMISRVEGAYRFLARAESKTTSEAPWSDAMIGVRHALEKLSQAVGRELMDERSELIVPEHPLGGVDACVVTASAARPLRAVLLGLASEWSLESLRRAALGTYVVLQDEIAVSGAHTQGNGRAASMDDERIQRMYSAKPDVICIAGGTDSGAQWPVLDLVEAARWAALLLGHEKPRIVYAGNAALRARVAEIIGDRAELLMAESNVRPDLDVENVGAAQTELEVLYATHRVNNIPGLAGLNQWTHWPVLPSARALGHVIQYLSANDPQHGVLGVDVGGATTAIAAGFNGQLYMSLRSDMGTSFGGSRLLHDIGWERVARWLDFEVTEGELIEFALNKELRPGTIAEDLRELYMEQAFAREMIRMAYRSARSGWPSSVPRLSSVDMPSFSPVIGSGAVMAHAPRPAHAALLLLDGLELAGQSTLVLDTYGLAVALGAMAMAEPLAAVQAIDQNGWLVMGHVVVPVGRMRIGEVVLTVRLEYEGSGQLEEEVKAGSISVLPITPSQKAVMHLRPRVGIDVGFGPGRSGKAVELPGSALGLIIDARGRPLTLPSDPKRRTELIKSWLWDMGLPPAAVPER